MKIPINFCPTGMVPTKSMNPSVPISPSEIIDQTHEAFEIGITIVHLHAREKDQKPTYKKSVYQEIIEGIRKHCPNLILCLSTSGRDFPEFEKRSEVIELQPDMCSLTLSSLNFVKQASINSPNMILRLFEKMMDYGVNPEFECFNNGMINYGKYLLAKYNMNKPVYWNLIFGNIAGFQPTFGETGTAVELIPKNHFIGFGGLGTYQLPTHMMAIAKGFGVRVGLEDNLWFDKKKKTLATNITLLKRIHDLIRMSENDFLESTEFGKLGFYNEKIEHIGV